MTKHKLEDNLTPQIEKAIKITKDAFASTLDYYDHLQVAAEIGIEYGFTESHIIACLLSDILILTPMRLDTIVEEFGIEVGDIIKCISLGDQVTNETSTAVLMIMMACTLAVSEYTICSQEASEMRDILVKEIEPVLDSLEAKDPDLSIRELFEKLKNN